MNRTVITAVTGLLSLVAGLATVAATAKAVPVETPARCPGNDHYRSCEATPHGPYGTIPSQPLIVSIRCTTLDGGAEQSQLDGIIVDLLDDDQPVDVAPDQQIVDLASRLVERVCGTIKHQPEGAGHDPVIGRCDGRPLHPPIRCAM